MGGGGGVSWGGCPTGGAEDQGWISGCAAVERPDKVRGQSLSSTAAPAAETAPCVAKV